MVLDIEMPVLNGFQVLRSLPRSAMPLVIFVTGYDQHALAAFDANALAYLLKPVEADRLAMAVERAQKLGEPERDLMTLERSLGVAEHRVRADLSRLPQWSGSLEALESLPDLSEETIREFDEAKANLKQAESRLNQRQQDIKAKLHRGRKLVDVLPARSRGGG